MWKQATRVWNWLPTAVRAVLVGTIVVEIGSTGSALALFGNLKFHPEIPWALPAVVLFLWLYWSYFTGQGWPRSTQDSRRRIGRVGNPPIGIWVASAPVIVFGSSMLVLLRLTAPYVMPVAAPEIHVDLSAVPSMTIVGILIAIALSSAVAEEVGYRGYMQQPMEERYGVLLAILLSGTMFWVAHLPDVTITHLPGHLAASTVFGLLAYFTRSLAPAILAHALADLALQPAYLYRAPALVWDALSARPVWEGHTSNMSDALMMIVQAASPMNWRLATDGGAFSILAWLFLIFLAATIISLAILARRSAQSR
jgi:membrane protease YdiL (CAAX protease family)